jgi:hypothetical protein
MNRQSRIADASQLEFRVVHCTDMIGRPDCCPTMMWDRRSNDDSLNGHLLSPVGDRRSTVSAVAETAKAAITLIGLDFRGPPHALELKKADQNFTIGVADGRRVIPALSLADSLTRVIRVGRFPVGERGRDCGPPFEAKQEWDHERRWT